MSRAKSMLRKIALPLLSILLALLIGGLFLVALGFEPIKAYTALFNGAFGSKNSIAETLVQFTPLLFCAISYATALNNGQINLGGEGQFYIGGIFGAVVGAHISFLPAPLHILVCLLFGFLGGAIWGAIVGILKARFGASELITTIMLNYIALELTSFIVTSSPLRDTTPGAAPRMAQVLSSAKLPIILTQTRLHLGIVFAIAAVIIYYFFFWQTTRGYELRASGMNPEAGRYSGMNLKQNMVLSFSLAGGFAGLGGIINIIGLNYYLAENFSSNYGFSGVAVALLGSCTPLGMILSAVLFGALNAGGLKMQTLAGVPSAMIYIIQGMIILFAVSPRLFELFKLKKSNKSDSKKVKKAEKEAV